jgi:hypothetical protein
VPKRNLPRWSIRKRAETCSGRILDEVKVGIPTYRKYDFPSGHTWTWTTHGKTNWWGSIFHAISTQSSDRCLIPCCAFESASELGLGVRCVCLISCPKREMQCAAQLYAQICAIETNKGVRTQIVDETRYSIRSRHKAVIKDPGRTELYFSSHPRYRPSQERGTRSIPDPGQ